MDLNFLIKSILIFVFAILLNNYAFGQTYNVVVILNDNSTVKGELLELTTDSVAVIEEGTGEYLLLKGSEISTVYIKGLNESIKYPISEVPDIFKKEKKDNSAVPYTPGVPFTPTTTRSTPFSQHKKAELYIGGGLSFPMSPEIFSDYWSMGFNFGGGIGYKFGRNISGNAYFSYTSFPLNESKFLDDLNAPSEVNISGGSASVILVTANIKALLIANPNQVTPYLLSGLGLFSLSTSDVTVSYQGYQQIANTSNSESAFGIVFGGGVDIPVSPTIKVFLEIGYVIGFTEGESTGYMPVKGGLCILL